MAIDWDGVLEDSINPVIGFVPKLIVFLVILFIAWLIAKGVSKFLKMILERVGFTNLLSKAGADNALRAAAINPLDLICKLAYYFILLIGLQLALTPFGSSNPVSVIVTDIVRWLPNALVAIVIVIIVAAVANAIKDILQAALGGLSYGALLAKIVSGFIIALGVIAALNQVGIGLSVTLPVLVAVLATVGGILVVGVGGGLISPMRARWEGWLATLEQDTRGGSGKRAAAAPAPATADSGAGYAPPAGPPPTNPPSGWSQGS